MGTGNAVPVPQLTPPLDSNEYSSRPTSQKILTAQELYSDREPDSIFSKAFESLMHAISALRVAQGFDSMDEFLFFDLEIMKAKTFLLSAFKLREIGDGYTALVNAIIWALTNRSPGGPTGKQLGVIVAALDRLQHAPYMHFDSAMTIMDNLEEAGLDIEPISLDLLMVGNDD